MEPNDYSRILMNNQPLTFLLEVVFRTVIMFVVILITLRASGKRGIKQLSVFELVLIIGLGSAAGDPMFYEDVALFPAFTVFTVVILLYILVTKLTDRVRWLEKVLEGEPIYVLRNGTILKDKLRQANISKEELFSELRLRNVEHLGQVKLALVEASGEISLMYFDEENTRAGLPIYPGVSERYTNADLNVVPVCEDCGNLGESSMHKCPVCGAKTWLKAIHSKRIG